MYFSINLSLHWYKYWSTRWLWYNTNWHLLPLLLFSIYFIINLLLTSNSTSNWGCPIDVTIYSNASTNTIVVHRVPEKRGGWTRNALTSVKAGAMIPPPVKWHRWYKRARAASLTRESKSRLRVCRPWFGWGYRPTSRTAEARFTLLNNNAGYRKSRRSWRNSSLTPAFEPFRRGLFNFLVYYSLIE